MTTSRRQLALTQLVLATVLALPISLYAADAGDTQSDTYENIRLIDEIVVEARRFEEDLQTVPMAVTALSAEDLANNVIADIRSLQDFTPGLNIEEGFDSGSARFFIRGLGTAVDNNGVEPGVGVYLDDVYLPTGVASNFDIFSLDRVEILRGPQGTLYGRNTFGGAIKLYSKDFSDEAEGYVSVATGTKSRRDIKAEYRAPLIEDRVWLNVGYGHMQHDGFQQLVHLGADAWSKNSDFYKLRMKAAPADRLTLTVTYDRVEADGAAKHPKILIGTDLPTLNTLTASWFGPPISDALATLIEDAPQISTSDIDDIESDVSSNTSQLIDSLSWSGSLDIGDNLNLKYIGSARKVQSLRPYDVDGKVSPYLTLTLDDEIESQSHELRTSWENGRVKAVGGLFYYQEEQLNNTRNTPNIFAPFSNIPGLLRIIDANGDGLVSRTEASAIIVNDILGRPTGVAFTQSSMPFRFFNELESTAVFLNVGIELTDQLNLSAGVRYTNDKKTATVGDEVTYIGGFTGDFSGDVTSFLENGVQPTKGGTLLTNPTFPQTTFRVDKNFKELTPSIVLDYTVNDDMLLFVSYQKGFQGGQLFPLFSNLQAIAAQAAADGEVDAQEAALVAMQDGATDEQTVDAVEFGLKSRWLDGRAVLNASAYYYQFQDLIASVPILIPGVGAPTVGRAVPTNAGEAESLGIEIEGELMLNDNLRLFGNLAYTDFELKEVLAPDPSDITTNIDIRDTFIDVPVLTPKFQGAVGIEYITLVSQDAELRAFVNVSYRGKMGINARALGETFGIGLAPSSTPEGDANYISPSLAKVDLGVSYAFDNWAINFAVKNVTDKRRPVATRFDSTGFLGVSQAFNAPRTWELGLNYGF